MLVTSLRGWPRDSQTATRVEGVPIFHVIDRPGPRAEALAAGSVMATLMFAGFTLLFPSGAASPARGRSAHGHTPQQAAAPDSQTSHALVADIAAELRQHYVDRAIGTVIANALLTHDKSGEYESLDRGPHLADRLNRDIQAASHALGIPQGVFVADVVYSARPLPIGPPPPMTTDARERHRAAMLEQHCLFETIEILPHDIGYIKLNGFGDAATCQQTVDRAMASVNGARTLIIDLRDNGGGFGETALHMAGYLFEQPAFFYDPRPGSPVPARTVSPIAGNALAGKRVYVLTSTTTQSAAEYFAYNMKMLERATIVGERTAGLQHSGAFRRITDHFGIGIQEIAPPANPYPVKGWEVIGVAPDVAVPRSEALATARKLAEE